jgi:hypothetical protein
MSSSYSVVTVTRKAMNYGSTITFEDRDRTRPAMVTGAVGALVALFLPGRVIRD